MRYVLVGGALVGGAIVDKNLFETLLNKSESEELDFKGTQYKMDTNEEKGEFIKDILAFANAWKTSDAYIICGIVENNGRAGGKRGVNINDHLIDSHLQQMVCSKTNRPPKFRYEPFAYEGKEFGIIIIEKKQDRPIYLIKNFGGLMAEEVYVRRGSSTDIASPDEIKKIGEYSYAVEPPTLNIQLKNKENGTIIEKDAFLKSTILTFRNPSIKCESSTEITTTTEEQNQIPSLNEVGKELIKKMKENAEKLSKTLEAIKYDPDYLEKLKDYLQFKKVFTPISFVMQNAGTSTAYDVKTEVRIKSLEEDIKDMLQVKVYYALIKAPSKNKFDLSEITLPILNKDNKKDIISKGTENEYLFEIKFGKIQPKDTLESSGFLYIGAFKDLEFEMMTRTFADNLPEPIEKVYHFRIEVNEENFKSDIGME